MTILFFLLGISAMFLLDLLFSVSVSNEKPSKLENTKKKSRKQQQRLTRPVLPRQVRAVVHTFLFVLLLAAILLFHNLPLLKSLVTGQPAETEKTVQLAKP